MKVLVIGSGGREHALVWKLSQSKQVKKIYSAPGNPGMAGLAELADIPAEAIPELVGFSRSKGIDLTIVGPEAPMAAGIVNHFEKEGLRIFAPNQNAAQLESSKVFAKKFMHKYHIPTASYETFTDYNQALQFIKSVSYPLVIKASGLAAGKGAVIANDREEAHKILKEMMVDKIFGKSGEEVVIEEYLDGEEISLMAFCDGNSIVPMILSQDHKKVFSGDEGPNTGGMGTYAPVTFVSEQELEIMREKILQPTLEGLQKEGMRYKGVIYAGVMLTSVGPKVLEFNCRLGDPEAQAVLPVLETDLVEICQAVIDGRLNEIEIEWKPAFATCVVLASTGYPGDYERGREIHGWDDVQENEGMIFHAGTQLINGRLVTAGGRVLGVIATAETLEKSIQKVYRLVDRIRFEGMQYRNDIGRKGVLRAHA
ncbi:MAG: phosphoribosylamine--glycine ligase [candidate division Zixibacteria bacterium RBG_16_48_11]|nr:MAG: phosphoribosylamine--glycine ligase [candidate division Zixibacteria bacterium RBG_16_48_11]